VQESAGKIGEARYARGMNVQQFLDQERALRQQREIGGVVADMERRAWAASRTSDALRVSEQLWRTNEQLGGFQKLTDDMTRSAIGNSTSAMGNAVSETMRVSEAFHQIMDPIPALKSALGSFTAISPAFDSMRYVTSLAKLDHQMGFLRDHSFSRLTELRSTASETMRNISAIVDLVKPFAANPLFQTESVAGKYVDLAEVARYADSHFPSAAATAEIGELLRAFMENVSCEMAKSRADAKGSRTIALASLWVAFLTLIWSVQCRYEDQASKHDNAAPIPMLQPQASPSPSPALPDVATPTPAPKGRLV
jgi:hypothetical protein